MSFTQEYVPERIRKVEKRLEENQFDIDAWNTLIRDAQVNKTFSTLGNGYGTAPIF